MDGPVPVVLNLEVAGRLRVAPHAAAGVEHDAGLRLQQQPGEAGGQGSPLAVGLDGAAGARAAAPAGHARAAVDAGEVARLLADAHRARLDAAATEFAAIGRDAAELQAQHTICTRAYRRARSELSIFNQE